MSIHSIALPPALFYIFHFRDRRDRACRNGGRSLAVPATQGVRDMAQNAAATRSPRRTAPKEERQLQLVRATIRSVAAHGLSDTTMATVASTAGLSQGIINLHFRSKQRLLVATLRHLADEYRAGWEQAVAKAGADPADRLAARVAADFAPLVCHRDKLAVWFAFWGESKSRPTYRRICAERDRADREAIVTLCRALIRQGGYSGIDADTVAATLSAMTAGLWLDLLTRPRTIDRGQANAICTAYLAATFTRHFPRPEPGATR